MYSSIHRLTPLFVIAALMFFVVPAKAQIGGGGGVNAPSNFPPPVFTGVPQGGGYGGYGGGFPGIGFGGYGTQWMQNPYEGYLNGAANMTVSNAQYQQTIQQAKVTREQSRRSALETRRATIEERQYELSLQPDPEEIRQKQMQKSLQRSRNNPPSVEIWSASALNDVLRDIQNSSTRGFNGPQVPLSQEVLRHVNVTTGTTYGGIGLLRTDGKLTWPFVLQNPIFDNTRGRLDDMLPKAVEQARTGPLGFRTITDIQNAQKDLEQTLDAHVGDMTPSDFTEASRYVRELKDSVKVLRQSDVAKYFAPAWKPQGSTVGELVQQMTQQGLRFAPAVSGDEAYYTSLHRALVDYDLSVTQLTATRSQTSKEK